MINLIIDQIKTWTELFTNKKNIQSMNEYINLMTSGHVPLLHALESYYKKIFSTFGHIIGYPDSFDTFRRFVMEHGLIPNDSKHSK